MPTGDRMGMHDLLPRWRLGAALFAIVLVLRGAGLVFGVVDNDETDFLLVGKLISIGGLPYVDAFDHKPPLLYLLFMPSASLTCTLANSPQRSKRCSGSRTRTTD